MMCPERVNRTESVYLLFYCGVIAPVFNLNLLLHEVFTFSLPTCRVHNNLTNENEMCKVILTNTSVSDYVVS